MAQDVDQDAAATIEEIGAVQSVDFPETSGMVEAGDVIAVVEGENDTFEVTAPKDGMILEVNDLLEEEPNLASEDPSEQGWLVKIEPDDAVEDEDDEEDDEEEDDDDDEGGGDDDVGSERSAGLGGKERFVPGCQFLEYIHIYGSYI